MRRSQTATIGLIVAGAAAVGCLDAVQVGGESGFEEPSSARVVDAGVAPTERPAFGPTVSLAEAPPPISGGTLAVDGAGAFAVAADPDRDKVYVVDLANGAEVHTLDVGRHARPERVALDPDGGAHVVLRGTGEVLSLATKTAEVTSRRSVCVEPRGIAYDARMRMLHVACATGELVTMDTRGCRPSRVVRLADDLRDVVVTARGMRVSTFRAGRVFDVTLDAPGAPRLTPLFSAGLPPNNVAWRMIAAPPPPVEGDAGASDDDVIVSTQQPGVDEPPEAPAYYASQDCTAAGPTPVALRKDHYLRLPEAVLPVDIALDGRTVAVAAAGNGHSPFLPNVVVWTEDPSYAGLSYCVTGGMGTSFRVPGQPTSVVFAADRGETRLFVLSREPAVLFVTNPWRGRVERSIVLSQESREDTGHALFHANAGTGAACASCHPDGRDDAHTWRSQDIGPRRTPSLLGTLAGTAPYHWDGAAKDMHDVMSMTFEDRMRGPALAREQMDALASWLVAQPRQKAAPARDALAASRGKALFARACTTCHTGALATNNETLDVGTGAAMQVPSLLGVGARAPYFHDGAAATLDDALRREHAGLSFTAAERRDLVAFLEGL